jgi:2-dehydro-3-deoxygluconokinase
VARILCFGELLLRLAATEGDLIAQTRGFAIHVGGAEANVAAALAQLGHDAAMLSILPDTLLGDRALAALRGHGVDTSHIRRRAGRMGLYFFEPGAGPRPGAIVYDRTGSAFAEGLVGVDWSGALVGGDWLHISGITPALGADCARATLALARAARAAGLRLSLDCNYRPSLWEASGGHARALMGALAAEAELMFGNHRDVALLTGTGFAGEGRDRGHAAAQAAFAAFPGLRYIAATDRRVEGAHSHRLSARIDTREGAIQLDEIGLSGIVDRIGAGDAFAAGVLHGLISGDAEAGVRHGLAAAAQKHFIPGDMWIGKAADLDVFWESETREIRR